MREASAAPISASIDPPPPDDSGSEGQGGGASARTVALDLLAQVLRRHQPFDEVFDRHPDVEGLAPRDRAFLRLLVLTVLRRLGQIDALIAAFLSRPDTPKADVRDLLRIGVAQLLFLGTPPHAAVSTTVALATSRRQSQAKGMINAVLRRVARDGAALLARQDAGRLNTPDWLWLALRKTYGVQAARLIVEAHLREPPLDVTVRDDGAGWAQRLGGAVLPTGSVRVESAEGLTGWPGFADGAWWVQDAAAALPAQLMGDVRGCRVIDLCAAPGGKTAQLAAAGAMVTAVDRSGSRLARLRRNLERLRLDALLVEADAARWEPDAPADAVLLDAPCTATGTIRRHPDIQRLKTPSDVKALAKLQSALLRKAANHVRPGGLLVYCTCSLQPEEGEQRVRAFLESGAPFDRFPVTQDEVGGAVAFLTDDGDVRTLPGHWADRGGIDGFYIARLRRHAD